MTIILRELGAGDALQAILQATGKANKNQPCDVSGTQALAEREHGGQHGAQRTAYHAEILDDKLALSPLARRRRACVF